MATPERIINAAATTLLQRRTECDDLPHFSATCAARFPESPGIWCHWCLGTMLRAVGENVIDWRLSDSPDAAAERARFEKEQGE